MISFFVIDTIKDRLDYICTYSDGIGESTPEREDGKREKSAPSSGAKQV